MWAEMQRACLFIVEGWAHRCAAKNVAGKARQVRTAACSAIESVVIAATAVLSGCPFDWTRVLTKKSSKVFCDASKTI